MDNSKRSLNYMEHQMATKNIRKMIFRYSVPTIISMLVMALYNIVDRFWVGQMPGSGENAIAGIGLCMPVGNIFMGLAMLVSLGATAQMSIHLGMRDKKTSEKILGNCLTLLIVFGLLSTIIGIVFKPALLYLIGAENDPNVYTYADDYLSIITVYALVGFITFGMNHPIRAMGNPKRFASTQILGAVLNMILDPIFIFNFNMGIKGAAYATIIAQFVSGLWVMAYYINKNTELRIHLSNLKVDLKIALKIFSIGLSPFFIQVAQSLIIVVANQSIFYYAAFEAGVIPKTAVSAYTVIIGTVMMFFLPILGINQGSQPIIGFNYGAGDYKRVKDAYKWSVIYCMAICTLGFVVMQIFAPQIIEIFNPDRNPQLIELGAKGLRYYAALFTLVGFQVPTSNFFQAIGKAKIAIISSLLRQVILLIPAYLILPIFFGLNGVWLAMPVADVLAAVITLLLVVKVLKSLTNNKKQEPTEQTDTLENLT